MNHLKVGHISDDELLILISKVQAGNQDAEADLLLIVKPLIWPIILKWKTADSDLEFEDLSQECLIHILRKLRANAKKIEIPSAYIKMMAKNFLSNIKIKAAATKRNLRLASPEEKTPEEEPAPDKNIIAEFYWAFPLDLQNGIEKSLDLIADLFRMRSFLRSKLKRDFKHDKQILKPIKLIAEARKLIGKMRGHDPHDADLLRLRNLREMPTPTLSGRPEEDKKFDEWLSEVKELEKKFGAGLNLYEAQIELSTEILNTEVKLRLVPSDLLDFESSHWIDYLPEIAGMKISPLNLIYRVWSKAPDFRIGSAERYRSRKRIALAFQYHKRISKGTPREFLFHLVKDIDISSPKDLEKSVERFRKAGYGQALQKKYRQIVELIYRESFGKKDFVGSSQ
jgi:DNA-directed RNA polymerase specialized sigma24 family protein